MLGKTGLDKTVLDKKVLDKKVLDKKNNDAIFRLVTGVVVLGLLSGCASSVVVRSEIPSPLIERLPINANLIYSDTFKNFTYQETEKNRSLKSLSFGQAQMSMFDQIFDHLLNIVRVGDVAKHVTIEPEILDFQYTEPSETNLKLYEVWLKYRLKLTDANDEKLADWTIKGYGKTPVGTFTSTATAFNAATNIALRDVGAQLAIRLPAQPAIKALLSVPQGSSVDGGQTTEKGVTETIERSITDGSESEQQ